MLDLSEEVDEENISTCKAYLERMAKMKVTVTTRSDTAIRCDATSMRSSSKRNLSTAAAARNEP